MDHRSFDEQDKAWMERFKTKREEKVPQEILKGFSAGVEAQIRQNQPSLEVQWKPKRRWLPVWTPVLAVLIIGSIVVLRIPMSKTVELAQATPSQISDEIADLSEVGAWTEEDDKSTGVVLNHEIDELELSKGVSRQDTKLT
ncbi:MAG: hypothetical protein AUJ72_03630 [Candidatus Omnitrophica bacterium CG1_02_46_14]|nr:MAG: hypothetical protein AUJ72_03630 [Candidatus Omnitrophica bacterium CG1_02_46_14]